MELRVNAAVRCCYQGCHTKIWARAEPRGEVVASSATCTVCRRVALCLEHFEAVRAAQEALSCPNCGQRRWHVVLFEPVRLSEALAAEIGDAGGQVEVRFVSTGATVDRTPPPGSLTPLAGAPEAPPTWQLVRATDLPRGARLLAEGLSFRPEEGGARFFVDGQLSPSSVRGIVRSASPGEGGLLLVEVADASNTPSRLLWFSGDAQGVLPNPFQLGNRGPLALDARRFVYLADLPAGQVQLREARIQGPGLVETRRVGTARDLGPNPAGPVRLGAQAVLVFEAAAEGFVPTSVDLAAGAAQPIGDPGAAPRLA